MSISLKESLAPTTDLSHQPSPIPPVPPIPNPLPSIASTSPPSQTTSNNISTDRQILKPVAPSKRSIPDKPHHKSWNNSDIANAFLPQELADIIATRQRRERAWHARLMICTTVFSSIESTLATFTKEVEIEEAVPFKAYLKLAIANFAAVDSSPPPPRVPLHTRPSKGNGNDSSKGKSKEKNLSKIAVAIPRIACNQIPNLGSIKEVELPKIIKNNDISWATVARKGLKKARMVQKINLQEVNRNKESQKVSHRDNSATSVSDKRLFVRLPQDHEWRKLSPQGIREVIVKKLHISPSLIGRIKPVCWNVELHVIELQLIDQRLIVF
ncbi:putative eka-like protein [Erysiphe necator]|uniref:Putative eka-like protein n=1 Tax=Uncinula necator TaxID=52586 RepID=A0A0B1P4N9_UNCNE|nr:putative eka-like protein [Erysiphe necator]